MPFRKVLLLKNSVLLLTIALLVAVIFTGCISSKKQPEKPDKIANAEFNPQPFVREDKSVVKVCQSETRPKSLDPISFDNKLDEITFHIFDRLVKWDENGKIIKDLAEDFERLDDRTFLFKLRKGIKFHNGEPFDARSVRFSIERLIDPATKSPGYSLLSTISKVEIIDPYTVKIITSQPDYLFIRKLALVQILPEKYFKEAGPEKFGQHPIGTSAYKFKAWKEDGSLVLTKNENYWGRKKPRIPSIIFKFIKVNKLSRKEQLDALFNGEVDLITELPGIHSLKVSKNPRTKVIKMPNQTKVHKMLFNSSRPPFSNINARKAVNLALNRDILIKVLAKGNGRKIATNSIRLEFGHNPDLKPYPYDLDQAKDLLKDIPPEQLNIKIAVTQETELIAQAVKKDLERVGITSNYTVMSVNEMAKKLSTAKHDDNITWDYDLTIYSGVDPFMHVGFLYGLAIYSKGPWSTTENEEVDRIYEELKVTLDKEKQLELCHKLEELAYYNYWYTPVFQVISTYGAARDLHLKSSATSFINLKDAYFEDVEE
jgi:peptide/nickel transport system substrate-binding protein